jgi:hypothetical protein
LGEGGLRILTIHTKHSHNSHKSHKFESCFWQILWNSTSKSHYSQDSHGTIQTSHTIHTNQIIHTNHSHNSHSSHNPPTQPPFPKGVTQKGDLPLLRDGGRKGWGLALRETRKLMNLEGILIHRGDLECHQALCNLVECQPVEKKFNRLNKNSTCWILLAAY